MKSSLHLKTTQHLTLTPRLQMAIRLLQLSTIELQEEIQHQVESNPLLEPTPANEDEESDLNCSTDPSDVTTNSEWAHGYTHQTPDHLLNDNHNDPLLSTTLCLKDHLRLQLELSHPSTLDHLIGITLIDSIDDNGYLSASITELHDSLNNPSYPITLEEIKALQHRIQHFDPIGCGARSLAETLLIQLKQLPPNTHQIELAKSLVSTHIQWLGKHRYQQLMQLYHIDSNTLKQTIELIQQLHPQPGKMLTNNHLEYITPDLIVKKIAGRWHVALNSASLPRLRMNTYYTSLMKNTKNKQDSRFMLYHFNDAQWFLKSIQNRQETLLKVGRFIVDYQKYFLEFGEGAMKPLILNQVAKDLHMHESTISRVTTQKFISTPRGVFELNYFFSNHLPTTLGGECSSTAIKATIKNYIEAEDKTAPLSDQRMAQLINELGIKIARRTVTHYREELGIAPSASRKSMGSFGF